MVSDVANEGSSYAGIALDSHQDTAVIREGAASTKEDAFAWKGKRAAMEEGGVPPTASNRPFDVR